MHRAYKKNTNYRKALHKSIKESKPSKTRFELLLNVAKLAPSTHNTQPWKLDFENQESISVYADYKKAIPVADPLNKYLLISVGALIKNIELAAKALGFEVKSDIRPNIHEDKPIAKISILNPAKKIDRIEEGILRAIIFRQNYRGFFQNEEVSKELKKILNNSQSNDVKVSLTSSSIDIKKLAKLTASGLKLAYKNDDFRKEIASLINHNLSRKRFGLHGYTLRMKLLPSVFIPIVMKKKDIGPKLAELNYKSFISAPACVLLSSADNKKAWLECGTILQDILVKIHQVGLTASIYVAALDTEQHRKQAEKVFEVSKGHRAQILFCVGKGQDVLPYSARKKTKELT